MTEEQGNAQPAPNPEDTVLQRYLQLAASQPGLVPELVRGDTVEEIDASVEQARAAYERIRKQMLEQYERQVPVGNPARSATDPVVESMQPEAKIAWALKHQNA
jgi:hypothetical protein